MATIQPVYGPDYGNLLLKGMNAYRGVKQIQREGAQDAETAEIKDLAVRANTDPKAMQRLMALDPQRAQNLQKQQDYEADRFEKERTYLSLEMQGRTQPEQIQMITNRIKMLKSRGSRTDHTERMLNMVTNEPEQAQAAIRKIIIDGERKGIIKPTQITGGGKLSEKSQFIVDKYGVEYGTPEFRKKMVETYPGEGDISPEEKRKLADESKIRRNNLIKGYKEIGFTPQQISGLLKTSKDFDEETGALAAQLELVKDEDPELAKGKQFEMEQKLRKEYSKETGDFQKVQESYRRIKAIDPTAAGDIALVFNYMKMLDPGSTVREGEYATAKNAAGVPDIIMNQYNKLKDGKFLNPKQRADFRKQSGNLFGASKKKEQDVRSKLQKIAGQYSLNPDNIFFAEPEQEGQGALTPLTTEELGQFK